jgi:hypothetical protein
LTRVMIQYLANLNLFPSTPPSTDQRELRTQRISTRIFILLLVLSLSILLIYTSAVNVTKTITIPAPDFNQYKQLYHQYQQSLMCPCKQVSISYHKFLEIHHTFHQGCNSYYVTDRWREFLYNTNEPSLYLIDFRVTGRQIFLALRVLCKLAEETISNNLLQFYSNNYVNTFVTPADFFQSQFEALTEQFISSTISSFTLSLEWIRGFTQANGLASALSTNYKYRLYDSSPYLVMNWAIYDNDCTCASSSACNSVSNIYMNHSLSLPWRVPGFVMGCLSLESFRQCNLECFYNETCLTELLLKVDSIFPMIAPVLNTSIPSQFPTNTTLGTMLAALMLETRTRFIFHERYYAECQPLQCSYTVITKNDAIYIVTTMISLIGGLVTALKVIVPRSVHISFRFIQYRQRKRSKIHPVASLQY